MRIPIPYKTFPHSRKATKLNLVGTIMIAVGIPFLTIAGLGLIPIIIGIILKIISNKVAENAPLDGSGDIEGEGSGTGRLSMIFGIISIFVQVFSIPGLILGIKSISQSKKDGLTPGVKEIVGVVLSSIGLCIMAFFVVMIIISTIKNGSEILENAKTTERVNMSVYTADNGFIEENAPCKDGGVITINGNIYEFSAIS